MSSSHQLSPLRPRRLAEAVAAIAIALGSVVVAVNHIAKGSASTSASATTDGRAAASGPVVLPGWAIGPFTRYRANPILASPVLATKATEWEWPEIFNPGVVAVNGIFHMLYRGTNFANQSAIGAAESKNGYQFEPVSNSPVISRALPSETAGVEDPRLYYLAGKYYSFFTGDSGTSIDINEAVSPNGLNWTQLGPVLKNTKDAAVVADPEGRPVQIDGHYLMYYGQMGATFLAQSTDFTHWTTVGTVHAGLPASYEPWELCVAVTNYQTTAGGPVNRNIDVFVAGSLMGRGRWYYAISEIEFSRASQRTAVAKLDVPVLYPQAGYEIYGHTPHTVFMNDLIFDKGQWWMYYGAGDSVTALATASLRPRI
jgi:predicted GH43/DUF377 family glycosyl hydrolase